MGETEKWIQYYGDTYPTPPTAMPGPDPDDIADLAFYRERPMDCSSRVAWALVYALYEAGWTELRDFFKMPERRYAIDCLSPGMVLWIMERMNLISAVKLERDKAVA